MSHVQLKIAPSLADTLDIQSHTWFILDREMGEGVTIRELLTELASTHTDFRKVVYNPDTDTLNNQVMLIINDSFTSVSDVMEARLNDGDRIVMLPVYEGG